MDAYLSEVAATLAAWGPAWAGLGIAAAFAAFQRVMLRVFREPR